MIRKFSAILTTTALLTLVFHAPVQAKDAVDKNDETYKNLNLFGDVFERVREDYVQPTTDKDLVEAAINGMLTHLDPHSSYLDDENFRDMQVQTKGEFGGLGIEVTMDNGLVKVVSPIDDTPAARAGLQPGDYITHLDGKPVMGLSLSEAVEKMRGPVNTTVKLTIRRANQDPFEVALTRDVIKIRAVRWNREGDVGYIRVTTFNEQTFENLKKGIAALQKDIGTNLKGFVLDLRNNPGGLLDQAVAVSDAFLNSGEIVSTRGRHVEETQRFNSGPGDLTNGIPLVVLINGGSASASEIVAGALQDHKRAIVLGTQSFGKGSVQTIIPLPGHGAMRLTTALYYTPSGRSIQAKGIAPDIEVPVAKVELLQNLDQTREADLVGALSNEEDRKATPPTATPKPQATSPDPESIGKPSEDYQLLRAIDLLKGINLYKQRVAESRVSGNTPTP